MADKEIRINDGESVTLIEETPCSCHISLGKQAKLFHYRFAGTNIIVDVEEDGFYEGFLLEAETSESKTIINLNGIQASCVNNALYLSSGNKQISIDFKVNHLADNTSSEQQVRGVANEQAIGAFKGLIEVKENLKAINGNQFHKALLLSDTAEIKSLPELAIFSEDVKCTHGSSIGELDENAVFYMQSRGISLAEARFLLTKAFMEEAFVQISDENVKNDISERVDTWLIHNIKN